MGGPTGAWNTHRLRGDQTPSRRRPSGPHRPEEPHRRCHPSTRAAVRPPCPFRHRHLRHPPI